MTTRLKGALFAAAATTALTAGSAGAETFALVQINQQALFFNQMNEGATAAAEAQGDELVIFNANNDPAAQNSAIETYIAQGVDGIVVVAIDVNGIMPVKTGENDSRVTAGLVHTCGVTTDDDVYCWGNNGDGRLGDGSTTDRSTPEAVSG